MIEGVRRAIGADSLGYISQQGMIAATEQPASRLCSACFDGDYPIELPSETALGKNVIEHMLANAARTGCPCRPTTTTLQHSGGPDGADVAAAQRRNPTEAQHGVVRPRGGGAVLLKRLTHRVAVTRQAAGGRGITPSMSRST